MKVGSSQAIRFLFLSAWLLAAIRPADAVTPPNDDFANAIDLTGAHSPSTVTNEFATVEADKPRHGESDSNFSVWWTWTASADGLARVSLTTKGFSPLFAFYEGQQFSHLRRIDTEFGGGIATFLSGRPHISATYYFPARSGHTYRLAVASRSPYGGTATVGLTLQVSPTNDNFTNRTPITGSNVRVTNSNEYASRESGEQNHGGHSQGASIWWEWTAPEAAVYSFNVTNSSIGAAFAVYEGDSISNLVLLAENSLTRQPPTETYNPRWFAPQSVLSLNVQAGNRLNIAVDTSTNPGQLVNTISGGTSPPIPSGDLVLQISRLADYAHPSSNDSFSSRLSIAPSATSLAGDTLSASRESGEPLLTGAQDSGSVWFQWTAPEHGLVSLTNLHASDDSSFHPWIGVYQGSVLTNLTLVASNNYAFAWERCRTNWYARDDLAFKVRKDESYAVCVTGGPDPVGSGPFDIAFHFTAAPSNSAFANRTSLSGTLIELTSISNAGAWKEANEPDHGGNPGGSSMWYTWNAPQSGSLEVSLTEPEVFVAPGGGSLGASGNKPEIPPCEPGRELDPRPAFFPVTGAYTGSSLSDLAPVAIGTKLVFNVEQGSDYQIAWDGNLGAMGEIDLFLLFTPPPINDDFDAAIPLVGTDVYGQGYLRATTIEPDEPNNPSIGSAWFTWTPETYGTVSVRFHKNDGADGISVFAGDALSRLRLLARGRSRATFFGRPGVTYYLAVTTEKTTASNYEIRLTAPPLQAIPPTSVQLTGEKHSLVFNNVSATTAIVQAFSGTRWTNVYIGKVTNSTVATKLSVSSVASNPSLRLIPLADPLPPVLPQAGLIRNGERKTIVLTFKGINQQRFVLDVSTQVEHWTPAATNAVNGSTTSFTNEISAHPARFYRIRPHDAP